MSVTETCGTMAADLAALRDWLQAYGVTPVALESTGVYWKPVYYMLEDSVTLLLINMQTLKHVPGRKTDVKDSEWLAQLLECGLLKASFVPPPTIRELRERWSRAQRIRRCLPMWPGAASGRRCPSCSGRWPVGFVGIMRCSSSRSSRRSITSTRRWSA
jgi:transposase